jgi:PilZ domain
MHERRRFPRHAVHKRARVLFEHEPPLDCVVFDLTSHGAGLCLTVPVSAPKCFELSFDGFRSRRFCRLAWQRDDRLGACFPDHTFRK